MKEYTYFDLISKSKVYPKSSGIYLAEAHSRNVFSLTPLIFSLVFLSLFLRFQHSRYDSIFNKFLIISSVFLIQIMLFLMKNLITKFENFVYMFYLVPITIIMISFLLIKYENVSFSNLKKVKNG